MKMKVTVLVEAILVIITQMFFGHSKLTSTNKSWVYSDLKNYQIKSHGSEWIRIVTTEPMVGRKVLDGVD